MATMNINGVEWTIDARFESSQLRAKLTEQERWSELASLNRGRGPAIATNAERLRLLRDYILSGEEALADQYREAWGLPSGSRREGPCPLI